MDLNAVVSPLDVRDRRPGNLHRVSQPLLTDLRQVIDAQALDASPNFAVEG
jgi:hypothetical protein